MLFFNIIDNYKVSFFILLGKNPQNTRMVQIATRNLS